MSPPTSRHLLPRPPACVLALLLSLTPSALPQPMSVEAVVKARQFASNITPSVQPRGELIAFTVNEPREGDDPERVVKDRALTGVHANAPSGVVYVVSTQSGRMRPVSDPADRAADPRWSPDGGRLLYMSTRPQSRDTVPQSRLWLWNPASGRSTLLSRRPVRGPYRWSPDGRFVLARFLPSGLTPEAYVRHASSAGHLPAGDPSSRVRVYSSRDGVPAAAPYSLDLHLCDLALVDVRSRTIRTLAERARVAWASFSPDGRMILVVRAQTFAGGGSLQVLHDVSVLDAATGAEIFRQTAQPLIAADQLDWSPDSRLLSFKTAREAGAWNVATRAVAFRSGQEFDRGFGADNRPPRWTKDGATLAFTHGNRLVLGVDVATGVTRRIASFEGHWVEFLFDPHGHIWSPPADNRITVIAQNQSTGVSTVAAISSSGSVTPLLETSQSIGGLNLPFGFAVAPGARSVAYFAQSASQPPDLWVAGPRFESPRRVTDLNPQLRTAGLGEARLIRWNGPGGQPLSAGLLLPPGHQPGRRHPLLVWVYGGMRQSRDRNRFGMSRRIDMNLHLFASRGYAVLLPDAPLRRGQPAADIEECVAGAIAKAVEEGFADPARIGVMGHSYGGYSALVLITRSNRFRAAVAAAPLSNLVQEYLDMDPDGSAYGIAAAEEGNLLMGGPLWEQTPRFLDNSPVFQLDRVRTPLLLLHGDADTAARVTHSEQVFVGLRRLGREVEFARYQGEGHSFFSQVNLADYWRRSLAWFDRHLRRDPHSGQSASHPLAPQG